MRSFFTSPLPWPNRSTTSRWCSTTARKSRRRQTDWAASSASCPNGSPPTWPFWGRPPPDNSKRAASARAWLGDNAIHKLGAVLERLAAYQARSVDIDGCTYREGLSAVRIDGGVAGNVIPDAASVTVNFRFAPDRSPEGALSHVHEVLDGLDVRIEQTDSAAGALPGLSNPAAKDLVDAAGGQVRAKYGWNAVSRFAARGIAAVNYGPGDPNLAHTRDELVPIHQITDAVTMLRAYLSGKALSA